MNKKLNQKGFTLIELLIVIVIIGILTGVLISIIDPVRQQNRSKNASLKAAISKTAFALNTARAGRGRFPYETELEEELDNVNVNAAGGTSCNTDGELSCFIDVAGTQLPETCNADNIYGDKDQANPCYIWVVAPSPRSPSFRMFADAFKLDPGSDESVEQSMYYVYDSREGFFKCPVTTTGLEDVDVTGTPTFSQDTIPTGVDECVPVSEE